MGGSSSKKADFGSANSPILPHGHPVLYQLATALEEEYRSRQWRPAVGDWFDQLDKSQLKPFGVTERAFETWMENVEECVKKGASVDQLRTAWGVPKQIATAMPMAQPPMGTPLGAPPGKFAGSPPVVTGIPIR